jgi:hypothetical protein
VDVGSHIQTIFVFSFFLLTLSHYILVVLSNFDMALEHGLILEDTIAVFVLLVSVRSYLGCFNLLWAYSAVDRRMHDICQFSFGHQFNHSSARIASSCLLV